MLSFRLTQYFHQVFSIFYSSIQLPLLSFRLTQYFHQVFSIFYSSIQLPLLSFQLTQCLSGRIRPYTMCLAYFIALFSCHYCILAYSVFVRTYPTIHQVFNMFCFVQLAFLLLGILFSRNGDRCFL